MKGEKMNGDTIYAWQERTEEGWGIIAAVVVPNEFGGPTMPIPLIHRNEEIVRRMGDLAIAHCEATGNAGRMVKFELSKVLEEMEATNVRRARN